MIPRRSRTDRADESAGRFSLSGNLLRATVGHINRRATCFCRSPFGRFRPPWTGIRPSEANRETGRSTNVPRRERPATAGRTVRSSRKKGSPSTDEAAERRPAFSPPPQRASPLRMPEGLFPSPHAPVPKEPVPDRPPGLAYEPPPRTDAAACSDIAPAPAASGPPVSGTFVPASARNRLSRKTRDTNSETERSHPHGTARFRTQSFRADRLHLRTNGSGPSAPKTFPPPRPVFLRGGIRCRGCRTGIPPSRIRA